MPVLHPFEVKLAAAWPPQAWCDTTVLLAVSGGADSVALARAAAAIRQPGEGRLMIAHLNHRLRGEASDSDEQFVSELARQLGLPCEVARSEPGSFVSTGGDGLEAAARAARYNFLQVTAERLGARYVVTAHTADDQAETILHRIVRGTGVAGLAGMQRARMLGPAVSLVRPLLDVRRSEVVEYLAAMGQAFREDESNSDRRFTRNRLRHDLLPQLAEQYNPQVREALLRLGSLAAEAQQVIDQLVEDLLIRAVVRSKPECVELDLEVLALQPPYLLRELLIALWKQQGWPLQAMGHAEWEQLAGMLAAQNERKQLFPGGIVAERDGSTIRLSNLSN
jgi:tRNA(Ile)-lysidine synthase